MALELTYLRLKALDLGQIQLPEVVGVAVVVLADGASRQGINKALGLGKNTKLINVGLMFIPDYRVPK